MDAILRELDFEKGGGFVTAIAVDDATGDVLMVAHMNPESLRMTLETGDVHYWSRTRDALWRKGEESGNVQRLKGLFLDCDGDVVLARVEQVGGAACHTGMRTCFFRRVDEGGLTEVGQRVFDPDQVYRR